MRRSLVTVVSAMAVLLLCIASTLPAQASTFVYWTFDALLYSGSLAPTTFSVCYSYDADQVAPVGESYVPLNSFDFTLVDTHFTRSDIFQGGQVIFTDGVAHDVTASFQVRMPPGSPVNNITFGFGGDGVIGYSDLDDQYGEGSFDLSSQYTDCGSGQRVRPQAPSVSPTPKRTPTPTHAPARKPGSN